MSEDFKKKLEQYAEGSLPEEQLKEVETELEKMELYQEYLDSIMEDKKEVSGTDLDEKKIIKKGKQRSLFKNVIYTVAVIIGGYILISMMSLAYFRAGENNRISRYENVLRASVSTTMPNVFIHSNNLYETQPFSLNSNSELVRQVGAEFVLAGRMQGNFLFSTFTKTEWSLNVQNPPVIIPPVDHLTWETYNGWRARNEAFELLDMLPEGTVAELYLSFTELMTTAEVLRLFEGKNMNLSWFGVDTGVIELTGFRDELGEEFTIEINEVALGFSRYTILDMGTIIYDLINNSVDGVCEGTILETQFMYALNLIQQYPNISSKFLPRYFDDFNGAIEYIEENGINIAGVVVTGPVKELLALQNEEWFNRAEVGEVALWNWNRTHDIR